MTTRVRIGGEWLDAYGAVGDLEDSTIWRTEGYSGDYELSCTVGLPADFSAPWLAANALVELVEDGVVTWTGFLGDPEPGAPWRLVAYGLGAEAVRFRSVVSSAHLINGDVDNAVTRGLRFSRYTNDLTGASWKLAGFGEAIQLDAALDKVAASLGKVWWVSRGELSFRSEPTAVSWVMAPNSTYLGTTDENLVTSLVALYTVTEDVDGIPITFDETDPVEDATAIAKFGKHEVRIDLTPAGAMTESAAVNIAQARFEQVGARSGWTNGFEMTALNSRDANTAVPDPLGVRAGQRVRIPGVTDMRSGVTYLASVEVTLGKVRRMHAQRRAICEPMGLVARDFAGALAAAQPKGRELMRV